MWYGAKVMWRITTSPKFGTNKLGYQAVVCVDIDTYGDSTGYHATGAVEAYCQHGDPETTVACANIHIDGIFANGDSGASTNTYTCAGDCGGGREILYVTTFDYTGGHDCTSSSGHDVWAEAAGDTVIDLPSYGEFNVAESISNDGANFSTGHYWVCP